LPPRSSASPTLARHDKKDLMARPQEKKNQGERKCQKKNPVKRDGGKPPPQNQPPPPPTKTTIRTTKSKNCTPST